jgi:hypothetical protein
VLRLAPGIDVTSQQSKEEDANREREPARAHGRQELHGVRASSRELS